MQTAIGPAAAEKSVWVDGKENWKNLTIRETLQPTHVVPTETAEVGLRKDYLERAFNNCSLGEILAKVYKDCITCPPRLAILYIRLDNDKPHN